MSESNDTSSESNSLGSDSLQQAARLAGSGPHAILRSAVLRPSVLGPSVLGSSLNSATLVTTNDTDDVKAKVDVACNPFMKEQKDEDDTNENSSAGSNEATESKESTTQEKEKIEDEEETDERPDPLTLLRKNGLERANLFAAAKNSIPRVERSGFVFGQNVHERVVGDNINAENTSNAESSNSTSTSGELLFSSVIQNAVKSNDNDGISKDIESKSLTDVAREYEQSRAQKRKFEEVETFTGEENEINIVDINCKLFAFINSNWEERGRGSLRLNDSKFEQECSRVVFRTSGNLRLLLNTKVWAGMVAERPSQKSLRLTAMDNTGKIKIFLLMTRPGDIDLLHKALVKRIEFRKISHPEEYKTSVIESNGSDSKNGSSEVANDEAKEAASATEPEADDPTEPCPKKPILAGTNNTPN